MNLVERLGGRFFLLTKDGLGAEISLRDGRILGPSVEAGLAISRPHLVTDPAINQRLKTLSLSKEISVASAVLLWSEWFDNYLWEQIEAALSQHGHTLENITLIKAAYTKTKHDVFLSLHSAVVRENGKRLKLDWIIRLP